MGRQHAYCLPARLECIALEFSLRFISFPFWVYTRMPIPAKSSNTNPCSYLDCCGAAAQPWRCNSVCCILVYLVDIKDELLWALLCFPFCSFCSGVICSPSQAQTYTISICITPQGVERYAKGEPFGEEIVTCFLIRRPTVQTKEWIACLVCCDRVKGSLKLHDLQRRWHLYYRPLICSM